MAVDFDANVRFIGFWFVWPCSADTILAEGNRHNDWFCGMWLNEDDTLEFQYRFHYYDDPDEPSEGERSWRGMKSKSAISEIEIEKHILIQRQMGEMVALRNGTCVEQVLCHLCDGPTAVAMLMQQPWFHKKEDGFDICQE